MYPYNVLKTFLPLVTRPCRFDQITRRKIKPRTEGSDSGHFDFHSVKEKTRGDWGPKMDGWMIWTLRSGRGAQHAML